MLGLVFLPLEHLQLEVIIGKYINLLSNQLFDLTQYFISASLNNNVIYIIGGASTNDYCYDDIVIFTISTRTFTTITTIGINYNPTIS